MGRDVAVVEAGRDLGDGTLHVFEVDHDSELVETVSRGHHLHTKVVPVLGFDGHSGSRQDVGRTERRLVGHLEH
jgi:hypothetical protein